MGQDSTRDKDSQWRRFFYGTLGSRRAPGRDSVDANEAWPALNGEFEVPRGKGPVPSGPGAAIEPGSDAAKERHPHAVDEVRTLLETIEQAPEERARSAATVEEMLDQCRAGQYSSKGVESMVDEILSHGFAPAMKAIAGLKGSDQTYAHCVDVSVILEETYAEMLVRQGKVPSEPNRHFALVAGFVHDIGKSEVPRSILDSTVRFAPDGPEMMMMRNHTTYGARILTEMGMHSVTVNVAHYHHVKRDTRLFTSYPDVPYEQVRPITRLASIVDVYQALIGRRRYKKNWVSGKAIEYLRQLQSTEFDEAILDNFVASIGIYPVGTLVRLSTQELAYVLGIGPREHPRRPIVAIVENAQGELLTHHSLLDLMLDVDVEVEAVVDHYEHYNKSEDQAYQVFRSIRIDG